MKKLLTLLFLACLTLAAAGETPKKFLVLWGQNGRPKIVYDLKERPQVLMTVDNLTIIRNGVETVYDKDDVIRFTYESVVPMTQPGDANGDGQVSITDVTTSVSHVQGQSPRMFSEEAVACAAIRSPCVLPSFSTMADVAKASSAVGST